MKYLCTGLPGLLAGLLILTLMGCRDEVTQVTATLTVTTLATGFTNPEALEIDPSGRLWISEAGSGKNDGQVSLITADGKVYPVITDFPSTTLSTGEVSGTDHILFADGILYVLDKSRLYKASVTGFKPGDAPVKAATLAGEDISQFVLNYPFVNNAHDTHLYSMTVGPDGALYMADAGANAIIRRSKTGDLSVLTAIPGVSNPTPVGPPVVESVPTGIVYDGQKFLVSTLLGFPFPAGKAVVYQVDLTGKVSLYQPGFNSLVDLITNTYGAPGPLVLEYAQFGAMGFVPKTGRLLKATGTSSAVLVDGLNQPTSVRQADAHTLYVSSLGDGTVLKVTY